MKFTKMHGIGNDYVYVNCFEETLPMDPARLSELISDRHCGIGSDGLILIKPSDKADFFMDIYNADGSRALMCGNGIRCVAKYVYDHGMTNMTTLKIETLSGIREVKLTVREDKVSMVSVDMGIPVLESSHAGRPLIPAETGELSDGDIWEAITVGEAEHKMVALSVGNPHAVFFVRDTETLDLTRFGPAVENHPRFPERTNVEFVQVADRENLRVRVWERGSGETMACGTGACASASAAMLAGFADTQVNVRLLGGTLSFRREEEGNMIMTGPATEVYKGEFDL